MIYKATNLINGKSYIGFDSNWPNRKRDHEKLMKCNNGYHFHNALRKYGWNNFEWEILSESDDSEYLLKIEEPRLIEEYKTFIDGYNQTKGGDGSLGHKISLEGKRKISQSNKGNKWNLGKKHSQDRIEANRKGHLGKIHTEKWKLEHSKRMEGKNNPMYGKKRLHSEETKKKMSETRKGKKRGKYNARFV